MNPEVSVLMPAYNAARYLPQAVESILGQTYTDFELVVVDDGSTDETPDLLAAYAARDPRVRVHRKLNGGLVQALLDGFNLTRGGLIARMDADDVCKPTRLQIQRDFLTSHSDHVAIGSWVTYIDPAGKEIEQPSYSEVAADLDGWHMSGRGCALCHPTAMFRRSDFVQVGQYRTSFYPAEDFDLWLRLAEVGRIALIPERLVGYRIHQESVSRRRAGAQYAALWRGLRDAIQRRKYPLSNVPFDELEKDYQIDWINLAISLGKYKQARQWTARRFLRQPGWRSGKHWVKAICGPALPYLTPVVRRLTRRPSDNAESA